MNWIRLKIILYVAIILIIGGCGISNNSKKPANVTNTEPRPSYAMNVSSTSANNVMQQLWSAHEEWRGTPYILGGSGISGVDCSSFTQIVFQDFFGIQLPRNTREQMGEGSGIRRNSIRPGDLIFFKTGRRTLHVGIAMEDGDFLHASTSSGVMISNLSDRYWGTRYLGTQRVF